MSKCANCTKAKFCKQRFSVREVLDTYGRPYDIALKGYTTFDFKAKAYDFATNKLVVIEGQVAVYPNQLPQAAIWKNIKKYHKDTIWFCWDAKWADWYSDDWND